MKSKSFVVAAMALALAIFYEPTNAHETPDVSLISTSNGSDYIKKVEIKIGDKIKQITLPGAGALRRSFAIDEQKWGSSRVIAFVLDTRGQMATIAYYGVNDKSTCFVGLHSQLVFDKESRLVIEAMHSSASEQIINRYKFDHCTLRFHDQLSDNAIIDQATTPNSLTRKVTRLKGAGSRDFQCEYKVENGRTVDPDNCFRR